MSPATAAPALVQVRRVVSAPPAEVFRAWTEPDLVARWFQPRGGSSAGAEMDVRVGGRYRWGMRMLGRPYYAFGEYVEVDPPRRLVFTFGWDRVPFVRLTDSLVTVELLERGDETEVVVTHERLASRTLRAMHRAGWHDTLAELAALLGTSP